MSKSALSVRRKWRDFILRQQASGLSVAAFCRREGLAESSFFTWKRKLATAAAATPVFVEATVADDAPSAAQPAGLIEVRLCGGRRVRVRRAGFDRDLLVQVVTALEALR